MRLGGERAVEAAGWVGSSREAGRTLARRRARRAFVFALAFTAACDDFGQRDTPSGALPVEELEVYVETTPVRRGAIQQRISTPGTLEARRESRIGAEVQGTIRRVFVDEGDHVDTGDPLFEIDPEPYRFGLRQDEAGLELARAERSQVEADLARARTLRARGVVAVQDIEKLETAAAVARARARQAAEGVALARHRLDRTLVRAPWAGSVAARLADEGMTALVRPQTIVLVLQECGALEARAALAEAQLFRVRPGDPARIHVLGLATPIETRVAAVSDAIDPATRTYSVRMRVPNPEHVLKAGVFAEVEIDPRAEREALLVPRDAVHSEEGRSHVLTLRDGRATRVNVTLGFVSEEEAELLAGPGVGTPVLVGEAAQQVAPGMRVRVTPRAEPGT